MSARRDAFRTGAAPVITDEGAMGPLPPARDARGRATRARSGVRRAAAQLALVAAAWVLVLASGHVTAREAAVPALARILAALTDVEGLLAAQEGAVRAAAASGAPVVVPGFPVPSATLTAADARTGTRAQWRDTILDAGAVILYARGMAAFAPEGAGSDGGPLSTTQNTALLIGGLSASTHLATTVAAVALGLGAFALAVRVLRLDPAHARAERASRLVAIGLALIVAATLAAVVALGTVTLLLTAGLFGTSHLADEVWAITRALAWTPLREALYLAAAGAAITLPAAGVAIWLGAPDDEEPARR